MVEAVFNSAIALLYFRHFTSAPICDVCELDSICATAGHGIRLQGEGERAKSGWKNVVKKYIWDFSIAKIQY